MVGSLDSTERAYSPQTRTARQRTLPQVGLSGQQRLDEAVVAVVGAGGLGAPLIQYLAAAGVGTIHVFDDDVVELSNLNRQIIHSAHELGAPKVDNAAAAAGRIAPEVRVMGHRVRLLPENVVEEFSRIRNQTGLDIIVDGSDSFETRFTVDSGAAALGLPVVFGAVMQWTAQVTMFWADPPTGQPVVLTDVFEDSATIRATPGCAETGVMGAVTGLVGSLMASETIKFVLGVGHGLLGRMLLVDALDSSIREVPLTEVGSAGVESSSSIGVGHSAAGVPSPIPALVPEEIPTGAHWLDVRRVEESASVPGPVGAQQLPLDEVLQISANHHGSTEVTGRVADGDPPVVVFCASGGRSLTAARHLHRAGWPIVGYLDGGLTAHPKLSASTSLTEAQTV